MNDKWKIHSIINFLGGKYDLKYFHVQERNGKTYYRVRRYIHNKEYNVIYTQNKHVAMQCYYKCIDCDWEPEQLLELKKYYMEHKALTHPLQYITFEQRKNVYRIQKWVKGRVKRFGQAKTLLDAIELRNTVMNEGWKKVHYTHRKYSPAKYLSRNKNNKYRVSVPGHKHVTAENYIEAVAIRNAMLDGTYEHVDNINPHRYITVRKNKTMVSYYLKKDGVMYGTYHSWEDAVADRDFWESIHWDMDLLDLY